MRSVAKDGVPPASEEGDASTESRIDYLRSHGVEVSLAGSRPGSGVAQAPSRAAGGMPFKYVYIPMDEAESVVELTEASDGARDVLEEVLAPRFAEESSMDESTVEREIASRLKNMAVGGAGQVSSAIHRPSGRRMTRTRTRSPPSPFVYPPAPQLPRASNCFIW